MTEVLHNVSRETLRRLRLFEALVLKWTSKINLVSRSDAAQIWSRHVVDSIHIFDTTRPNWCTWVDFGSGGGFPGIVVAILSHEMSDKSITLIESDARKATFLRAALRETGVSARVITNRIENVPPMQADIVSARALSDLSTLIGFADRHLNETGVAIFAKGATWRDEVAAAKTKWHFDYQMVKSKLEEGAAILSIQGVSRV